MNHLVVFNAQVFGEILALDDFLTFKKKMVARNAELELEALTELQKTDMTIANPFVDVR